MLSALAAATALPAPAAAGTRRSALVIGNAEYLDAPLRNPVNDARLVASTLERLGFEVMRLENASLAGMIDGLRRWIVGSRDAGVRAFYFAGHGTQYQGRNFLVPVDLAIEIEPEIERGALLLTDVVEALSGQQHGVNFVIIDACRTDPKSLLRPSGRRTRGIESLLRPGFAALPAPRGTVVAYSTSPGALALDGAGTNNSVFTRALASEMLEPGLPVESLFKRVRLSVMRATRNAQVPWESSSLVGDFCFRPNARGRCVPD
ncbi:MAG: caspase family protein [Burkholderiaceae bacterium]